MRLISVGLSACIARLPGASLSRSRKEPRGSRRRLATALLTLVSGLLLVAAPGRAASDDIHFSAALSPENETTPTESPAKGHIDLWLERATLKIRWRVTFQDLSTPLTSAALHGPENAGANAGVLINLGKGRSPLEGSATMSDGQFQYLITTRVYANIVTQKFPAGEIRGHLRRQLASTSAP